MVVCQHTPFHTSLPSNVYVHREVGKHPAIHQRLSYPGGATCTLQTSRGCFAAQATAALHSIGFPAVAMAMQVRRLLEKVLNFAEACSGYAVSIH